MLLAFEAGAASGFEGDFAPDSGNWVITPDQGSVVFNGLTNLTLAGPRGPLGVEVQSEEVITYTSLLQGGTLGFHWSLNVENGLSATAYFVWGADNNVEFLASGPLGYTAGGDFFGTLQPGDPFSFVLDSDVIKGKGTTPQFMITEFGFDPVPEPALCSFAALCALTWWGYARLRRRRAQPASAAEP